MEELFKSIASTKQASLNCSEIVGYETAGLNVFNIIGEVRLSMIRQKEASNQRFCGCMNETRMDYQLVAS